MNELEFEIALAETTVIPGEEIVLEVALANLSSAAIVVPDGGSPANRFPLYRVAGPAGEAWVNARGRDDTALADPLADAPSTRRLAPGESTLDRILLDGGVGRTAGIYSVEGSLPWADGFLHSNTLCFTVDRPVATTFSVGADRGAAFALDVRGAWLFHGERIHGAVRRCFSETSHDTAIVGSDGGARASLVAPDARDLVCAVTDGTPSGLQWIAWLEGSTLCAHSRGYSRAQRLDLPEGRHAIVRSPVARPFGLDVLVVSDDATLSLARFHRPELAPPPPAGASPTPGDGDEDDDGPDDPDDGMTVAAPALRWRAALPARPTAITATIGPAARPECHVAFVLPRDGGIAIFHANLGAGEPPVAFRSVHVPDSALLPQTPPAVLVEASGAARVAVLFTRRDPDADGVRRPRVHLAEITFAVGQPSVSTRDVGSLPHVPRAGCVACYADANGSVRWDWAVLLGNGDVSGARADSRIMHHPGTRIPASPLQLVSVSDRTLLAVLDPDTGPQLAPLYPVS